MAITDYGLRITQEVRGTDRVAAANRELILYDRTQQDVTRHSAMAAARIEQDSRRWESAAGGFRRAIEGVVEVGAGLVVLQRAISRNTEEFGRHVGSVQAVTIGYRAMRLAMSPTWITGAAVGFGLLAEAMVRVAKAQAELVRSDALKGAAAERDFQSTRTILGAGRARDVDTSFLLGVGSSEDVRQALVDLKAIADPAERARVAVRRFGDDAEKALGLASSGFIAALDSAGEMALRMDGPTRASVDRLKESLSGVGDVVTGLIDKFGELGQSMAQSIAIGVARARDAVASVASRELAPSAEFVLPGGPVNVIPSKLQLARGVAGFVGAQAGGPQIPMTLEQMRSQNRATREAIDARRDWEQGGMRRANDAVWGEHGTMTRPLMSELSAADSELRREFNLATIGRDQSAAGLRDTFTRAYQDIVRIAREQLDVVMSTGDLERLVRSSSTSGIPGDLPSAIGRDMASSGDMVRSSALAGREMEEAYRQTLDHQTRMIELLAGPGGEIAAVQQIYALRMAGAKSAEEAQAAERSRMIGLAQVERQRLNELRQSAGSVFDAVLRGGGGLRDFAKGLALTQARGVFQNLAVEMFGGRSGRLALPGQTRSDGTPNALGRILGGTVFGADPSAGVQMTAAQVQLQAAQIQMQAAGTGIGGAIAGGVSAGAGRAVPGAMPIPAAGRTSALGRNIGIGGAVAVGAFGVADGVRQGGAQGAMTAGGAAAGAAATILALSGVSGPAAPIVAAVGLGLMAGAAVMGSPKDRRRRELDAMLSDARSTAPAGRDYGTVDTAGRSLEGDRTGGLRVVVNINALDARSVIDRRRDIGEAVRVALTETGPLAHEMRRAVLGV